MRPSTLATLALVFLPAMIAFGCGRETTVSLTDLARHQLDQVTTRWVPADHELAGRLAADGWRAASTEEGKPALRMTRDRARMWFFSSDGAAAGADLHLQESRGEEDGARRLSFRLNDRPQGEVRLPAEGDVVSLRFAPGSARSGWNALDLHLHGADPESEAPPLELVGIRFRDRSDGSLGNESPRRIRIDGGELWMPGESLLDLAFEVPPKGRLEIEATGEAGSSRAGDVRVGLQLLEQGAATVDLGGFALDPGGVERLAVDLSDRTNQAVSLTVSVDGPRSSFVRFSRAEIVGVGERHLAEAPIAPAAVEASGRLGQPDVFVIVLDAARADAFGTYGAEHPTPAVDALAEAGTRFDRALAPSSWTGQSIPALLTGFFPDTLHTERWGDPLPEAVPGVGELVSEAGYRTVLWSQHPIYTRAPSLVRGFQQVRYSGRRKRSKTPHPRLLLERKRPTFALIHLLPPHSPYTPPAPFRGSYTADYTGRLSVRLGSLAQLGRKRLQGLTPEEHAYIRGRYQETVAFADSLVGRIVALLKANDRYENSLIVVTSDHGEAFFEHGRFMHSREVYQEFLRIPMVVKWPADLGDFAAVVETPVSLIDLVPTLADGLGVNAAGGFQGRSLLPIALDRVPFDRSIYAATRGLGDVSKPGRPRWMLERGDWRVIHDPVAGRTELYAVEADPGETRDLAEGNPTVARLMLQRLLRQRDFNLRLLELGPRAEVELDPEMIEELKALGYL